MTDVHKNAYQDYLSGMKYADIAAKYDVTINTVKSWYNRHWKKEKYAHKDEKSMHTNPKGAPSGSQNNVKHGAYKKVSWDILEDEEERALIENINYTPEEIIRGNYKNLLLRERRLLKLISQYKQESEGNKKLILGSVTKTHSSGVDGVEDKTVTVAEAVFNALKVYETELTKIEAQKTRVAVELKKMELEEKKNAELDGDLLNDNMVSLAQILREPLAPHEINIEKEGDED